MTRIIVAICGVFTETLGMFMEGNSMPAPSIAVVLRGGPLCGTPYCIRDITCPIIETLNGIRYTYRCVRFRKDRPIIFEHTFSVVVDPKRLARIDRAISDECHKSEPGAKQ
jgi:hypothetical protein